MDVTAAQDAPPELDALYILSQLFTWVLLMLNAFELFTGYGTPSFIASTLNFTALSAYAGHRQIVKWRDPALAASLPQRKGENFVVIWGVFLLVAELLVTYVGAFDVGYRHVQLHMPHELLAITLEVVSVFTGTKISTTLRMPAGKAGAPGGAEDGGEGAPPSEQRRTIAEAVMQSIRDGALPHDGKWYTSAEIQKLCKIERSQKWAVNAALRVLVAQGAVEKEAKDPRDPHARYRWKVV